MSVTVRDAAGQSDYGGDYEDGSEGGAFKCTNEACGHAAYVTGLCDGQGLGLDSGKFHNHYGECPGFGKCIGDYREAHCSRCNKHFFAGLSGFECRNCERRRGGGGGGGKRRRFGSDSDDDGNEGDCAVM